jgi:hypothetical protein
MEGFQPVHAGPQDPLFAECDGSRAARGSFRLDAGLSNDKAPAAAFLIHKRPTTFRSSALSRIVENWLAAIEGLPIPSISRFPNPKVSDILNHALIVFDAIVLCFRHPTYVRMGER